MLKMHTYIYINLSMQCFVFVFKVMSCLFLMSKHFHAVLVLDYLHDESHLYTTYRE